MTAASPLPAPERGLRAAWRRLRQPSDELSPDEIEAGLGIVVRDGLASQTMATLTTGVFLVGLAVEFEASNMIIGVLAAIPFLAHLLQLPAIFLVERMRARRVICAVASGVARLFLVPIALSPLIPSSGAALAVVAASLVAHTGFGAVSACAWLSWMRDFVPEKRFGAFFSRRLFLMTGLGLVVSLAAGAAIDVWQQSRADDKALIYTYLFLIGFAAGAYGVTLISRIPEPRMPGRRGPVDLLGLISEPFRDDNFRRLMGCLASWNFAVNLAAPFFAVYLLRRLDYAMTVVIALTVISQIANVAFLRVWGALCDRYTNKAVMAVCCPLFVFCLLGWIFVAFPDKHTLTMPLLVALHVLMGISTAGVSLASGNIALKLSPKGQATAYLAANSVVVALASGLAPILGGIFVDFFDAYQLAWTVEWNWPGGETAASTLGFRHWDFFFAVAFAFGLYSIHRLTLVTEKGEIDEPLTVRDVVAETRRSLHSASTAAGLQRAVALPFTLLWSVWRRPKATPAKPGAKSPHAPPSSES